VEVGKVPEDRSSRLAFLEGWAKEQQRRPYADEIARIVARAKTCTRRVDSLGGAAVIPVVVTKAPDSPVDRAAVFDDLMAGLRECEWADPIVSECGEPRYIVPTAVELSRNRRPNAPWLLYMEDDVILGPDFGLIPELLREADERFPEAGVASFFSGLVDEPGWSTHPMKHFSWLQCAAIRGADHLADIRAFIDDAGTSGTGEELSAPDLAVRSFFATKYQAYAVWCPSLVQHADLTSVFFSKPAGASPKRISRSYERAYS